MRLYLSSYRLGDRADLLFGMLPKNARAGVITNAADLYPPEAREAYYRTVHNPITDLRDRGLDAHRLDLRDYFGNPDALKAKLETLDLVWATGGNAFLLRRAMRQSGFDALIGRLLAEDRLAYGGDSAGACVAGPNLKGLELMDEPYKIADGYDSEPVWDGLNLIPVHLVPHYDSDHPESEAAGNVAAYMLDQAMPYRTMRDGDVLVRDVAGIRAYERKMD